MSSDRGVSWDSGFTTTIVSLIHHGNANIDAFQWSATFSSHKKRKWVFKFNWCEVLFDFFPPSQSAAVKCVNHQSWQMREAKCQMDTHTVKVLLVGVIFCVLLFCFSISPHFRPPSGPLTSSNTGMWRHDASVKWQIRQHTFHTLTPPFIKSIHQEKINPCIQLKISRTKWFVWGLRFVFCLFVFPWEG